MSDIPDDLRKIAAARAGGRCEYCHVSEKGQVAKYPIDHVVPRGKGGLTESSNLAVACPRCNGHKWAHVNGQDPQTGETVRLFNPRQDLWESHFCWSPELPFHIQGTTAIGRATVRRLCMNDPEIVEIRRLLVQVGFMTFAE